MDTKASRGVPHWRASGGALVLLCACAAMCGCERGPRLSQRTLDRIGVTATLDAKAEAGSRQGEGWQATMLSKADYETSLIRMMLEARLARSAFPYDPQGDDALHPELCCELAIRRNIARVHTGWGVTAEVVIEGTASLRDLAKSETLFSQDVTHRETTADLVGGTRGVYGFQKLALSRFCLAVVDRLVSRINTDEDAWARVSHLVASRTHRSSQGLGTPRIGSSNGSRLPRVTPPAKTHTTHVLVIGVGAYDDSTTPRLRYATLDAEATYGFFRASPKSPARPAERTLRRRHGKRGRFEGRQAWDRAGHRPLPGQEGCA